MNTGVQILKAGPLYFALVFGAGFVLGAVRTLWVVPRLGVRKAELLEAPFMLLVTFLAARWIVVRLALPPVAGTRLGTGVLALALMLAAEFGLLLRIRGLTIRDYLASRDRVSSAVYYVLLGVFAIMPLLVGRTG